jgi:hypothetical protein
MHQGWHVNSKQHMISNSPQEGIPAGIKFSIKAFLNVRNENGGRMLLTFKMVNFTYKEHFRILINGVNKYISNTDTVSVDNGMNLEPENE